MLSPLSESGGTRPKRVVRLCNQPLDVPISDKADFSHIRQCQKFNSQEGPFATSQNWFHRCSPSSGEAILFWPTPGSLSPTPRGLSCPRQCVASLHIPYQAL